MAMNPSAVAIQAAVDGNLRLLKKMASKIDLREAKNPSSGWNALHFAAFRGRLEVCKFLVEESVLDVNCTTADGWMPVAHAAEAGEVSVLRYLLDHGGDPVMPDTMGNRPLHSAAQGGHCEAITLLLSRGVDVDAPNTRLATPLDVAAGKGQDQAVKVLLEHGADFNRVAHKTFSPLMRATYAGSLKCIKLLVEAGADVNFVSPYGPSPLLKAVTDGSTNIVKFLLGAGADPNISDGGCRNPIMWAACCGRRDLVEILFPHTKPIARVPNWSVDGIISTTKSMPFKAMAGLMGEHILDAKPQGNKAFSKGDYLAATSLYAMAMLEDPLDATLFANRSLCWLRLGDGERALLDAQQCKMIRPCWSKAWYREGAALRLLKVYILGSAAACIKFVASRSDVVEMGKRFFLNYKGAANAFTEALKLDPENDEIKTALRPFDALRCAARSEEHNT